jgi:hypothetical protein
MEIHIIQVGQIGLTSLRKCIPEQQKGDKHSREYDTRVLLCPDENAIV